jgi:dipeptidyl-peptidase-4
MSAIVTDPTGSWMMPAMSETVSFPRLSARTARFTLGVPKAFAVSPDGARVPFLRSASGTDRAGALWCFDVDAADERQVADPAELLEPGAGEELSAAERARRERLREGGAGITGYATDRDGRVAAFALSSRLFLADLVDGGARELPASGAVIDPRPSPDGARVAYAAGGALHVVDADGSHGRPLAEPDGADVTYGLAEFAASEELERYRGFWWAPSSDALLVALSLIHISEPTRPY